MKIGLSFILGLVLAGQVMAMGSGEVNIYSYRQPFLIEPVTEQFTKETGIKVNITYAKSGIAEKLQHEGKYSPADMVLTADFNRLVELTTKKLTRSVDSPVLRDNIPAQYRDYDGHWFALTTRARVIYAAKGRVADARALSYEDLADARFKGRVCIRSGKHPYNISLIASMIAHHGLAGTKKWLLKVKDNLARRPQGNDRGQVKAIKEGVCDVSLGNSYYYGKMMMDKDQRAWADAVDIIFPNQQDHGTHINISGMVLTKYAPNKQHALLLMEFLTSITAQRIYAAINMEYPVNSVVPISNMVKSWGTFKADDLPLTNIVKHRQAAYKLLDEVRFDL